MYVSRQKYLDIFTIGLEIHTSRKRLMMIVLSFGFCDIRFMFGLTSNYEEPRP